MFWSWFKYPLVIIICYFVGNINFARIISREKMKKDITTLGGSSNPGTMNMYRNFGFKIGVLTMVLDIAKGVIPALLGHLLLGKANFTGAYIGGTSAVVGHIFPVIYKFKGGKGIATAIGMFAFVNPGWMAICFVGLLIFLFLFEYGSLGSITATSVLVCIEAIRYKGVYVNLAMLSTLFVLLWWAHRKNIYKLLVGKEGKTNFKILLQKLGTKLKKKKPEAETLKK